ncbi:MAG TPA: tetratricopeptide repeat protein [Gemmatimonadaceae bacterium]|jgi:tetratricopeptide (TPR) repeat protein|nr:tetratricopeptide repeat protein [Gemmatimonadaceae bacterium]
MRTVYVAVAAGTLALSACAPAISGSAEDISRLEQQRTADPNSESVHRSLGIAYFKANRYDDAKRELTQAASMDPNDGVPALFLGLTDEAQSDIPGARAAYENYLKVGTTSRVKNQIQDRLAVLVQKENEVLAKRAVAQEQQLSAQPGNPRTVAVTPFRFTGQDTTYKPLERGFAELVTTDLARSPQLTVLERERVQALLDEIQLQQTNGAGAGTGVRAGKMLGAGRLVGGSISQTGVNQLTANAIVTNVQTTQTVGAGANDQQPMDQVFTLEKNIVFKLFDDLGVTLTTAERNAIEQRPTRSLAAFLSYSQGLELEDAGRFDDASHFFDNAVRLDPNFGSAVQKSQETHTAAAGVQVSAATVETGLRGSTEGQSALGSGGGVTAGAGGGTAALAADGLNPSTAAGATSGGGSTATQPTKDASTSTGADNPTEKTAKVTLVIHQPKP